MKVRCIPRVARRIFFMHMSISTGAGDMGWESWLCGASVTKLISDHMGDLYIQNNACPEFQNAPENEIMPAEVSNWRWK